jgi:hypothetical protein
VLFDFVISRRLGSQFCEMGCRLSAGEADLGGDV